MGKISLNMERFAHEAQAILSNLLPEGTELPPVEVPPDTQMGDFALACFKLGGVFKKKPNEVPLHLLEAIETRIAGARKVTTPSPGVLAGGLLFKALGPYLNIEVPKERVLDSVLADILQGSDNGEYGKLPAKSRGKWVLEYSSPNIAKPFQIYHFRSTGLGAVLARAGKMRGWDVTSINHLGDWGTQYGKLWVAHRLYGKELPPEPTISDLVSIYIKFHDAASKDPALEQEARDAFSSLESGEPKITAFWKKCVEISLKEFTRLYSRLGVHFEHIWGESHYRDMIGPLLDRLIQEGLLVESEGAWVVPVTDERGKELPPCILKKKDGASIYATRDLAAAIFRFEQFKFDQMTYIVGAEQKLHFQQLFAVLKRMGLPWADRCEHVATGLYRFQDAKMSTRKGNFVTFEEMLELTREKVSEIIRSRKSVDESEIHEITESVAIGALVFHDLSSDPAHDVNFSIERVTDFEGETGPYLQYAHTRCLSILRKARDSDQEFTPLPRYEAGNFLHPNEINLVKMMGRFPEALERTLTTRKASALCHYLIQLSKSFGQFYRECQVLGEAKEITQARLALVEATRRIFAKGLAILGIPTPSKM